MKEEGHSEPTLGRPRCGRWPGAKGKRLGRQSHLHEGFNVWARVGDAGG